MQGRPRSVETVSSQQLAGPLRELMERARIRCQRQMLVLSGDRDWCLESARKLLLSAGVHAVHWFSDRAPEGAAFSQGAAALRLLGTELDALVFDAWSGFDPDAFGALSGAIKGGGLLILLTPPLQQWPAYPDPQNDRITVVPYRPDQLTGRYLRRLVRELESDPHVMLCDERKGIAKLPDQKRETITDQKRVGAPYRTLDQQLAVEAVIKVVTGHRRRPVVLTSDRGRGKSAAFGIAAAKLVQQGRKCILLTGPRRQSVEAVLEHAHSLLPDSFNAVRFVAPDELVHKPLKADLLLVDEAAAIPAPLLEALLKRYSRIAFATTIHGYEGTGRGFAVRFSRILDKHSNSWKALTLSTPIRWAVDDPLERLVFRMLSLDANAVADEQLLNVDPRKFVVECLDRDRLLEDEVTLSELFGLLVLAHYRTRPLDLRHMLDGPNLSVYVVRIDRHVAATALVAEEGGFDSQTAQAIWAGKVRPHGHLLPETLAAHQGILEAPQLLGARIMRIAVHPAVQRQGLGARLINFITEQVQSRGYDYIGSSFGASAELLDFWRYLKWVPVRLSIQSGASSGARSVVMLTALNSVGQTLVDHAAERFFAHFPHQLSDSLQDLDTGLVRRLMLRGPDVTQELDQADRSDIRAFAFEQRLLEVSIGAVWRLACDALMSGRHIDELDDNELTLLIARVLQKRPWRECVELIGATGRSQALMVLKHAVAKLAG